MSVIWRSHWCLIKSQSLMTIGMINNLDFCLQGGGGWCRKQSREMLLLTSALLLMSIFFIIISFLLHRYICAAFQNGTDSAINFRAVFEQLKRLLHSMFMQCREKGMGMQQRKGGASLHLLGINVCDECWLVEQHEKEQKQSISGAFERWQWKIYCIWCF